MIERGDGRDRGFSGGVSRGVGTKRVLRFLGNIFFINSSEAMFDDLR